MNVKTLFLGGILLSGSSLLAGCRHAPLAQYAAVAEEGADVVAAAVPSSPQVSGMSPEHLDNGPMIERIAWGYVIPEEDMLDADAPAAAAEQASTLPGHPNWKLPVTPVASPSPVTPPSTEMTAAAPIAAPPVSKSQLPVIAEKALTTPAIPLQSTATSSVDVFEEIASSQASAPSVPAAKEDTVFAPLPAKRLPTAPATSTAPDAKALKIPAVSSGQKNLTGQVEKWRGRWRLRYADFDAEDPHGGVVVLEGNLLHELQDGCRISVQGQLLAAPADELHAVFRIYNLEVQRK